MKINKKVLIKYFHKARKLIGWTLIFILMFSGFLRIVELNTTCDGIGNYYDFQNNYCTKSGFLNLKIKCELPQTHEIICRTNFKALNFNVVKSTGQIVNDDNVFNLSLKNI